MEDCHPGTDGGVAAYLFTIGPLGKPVLAAVNGEKIPVARFQKELQKLASDYQIQLIPTVVFFDRAGKEVFRHQGFMSEEKVKEQLAKIGVV